MTVSSPAASRHTILFELGRLAVVVAAPLLAVIAFLLLDAARDDLEHATDDARRLADQTAARTERYLADFRTTLAAIAARPQVRALDPASCDPALATLRELIPHTGNIIVADTEGWIVCAARPAPGGERIRIIDLDLHRAVLRDGRFRLSRPLVGRISRIWVVTAVQPVRDAAGRIAAVTGMSIDLRLLQPFGDLRDAGTDVVAGIVARPGVIVAHSVDPARWVGTDAGSEPVIAAALGDAEHTLRASWRDGTERLWAFSPIADTDWVAYAGVSARAGIEPVVRRSVGTVLVVLAIIALTMFAAAYAARRMARPVRAIADVARARTAGTGDERAPVEGPREVADVATAFNTMIDVRQAARTRLQLQLGRMNLLDQITRAIGSRQDLQSIFQVVTARLEEDLPVDFACIAMHTDDARTLVVAGLGVRSCGRARQIAMTERATISVEDNDLARCLRGELVHEPDISALQLPFPARLASTGLRTLVAAPLAAESKVFGVLIAARTAADSFTSNECEFLRQLSEHVALAAHQAQLYSQLQVAYENLRQSQQMALQQERLRALGQMASGVAHDINNAIAPIALYADSILEREAGISDRAREQLVIVRRAIEDVSETVNRMRDFSRPRETDEALARVDLNVIVAQVLELTRVRWRDVPQQRGVVLTTKAELPPAPAVVMGREGEIRDALTNLIFNAVDAMPEGGALTIRVVAGPGSVTLAVVDTGIGMDDETRRRCIEPFFTTKGERGTGLGLAMVYGMAQRHGATLAVDSAPGRGTTVRLVFSAVTPAPDDSCRPMAVPKIVGSLSILLVDDDPVVLESLRSTLELEGQRVIAADGGQKAIDAFRASVERGEPFDVVITDLGMPHVDGRRVAAAVKAVSPTTPVVLLTGWGQRLVEGGELPEHVDRVLSKPPRLVEVRAALAELTAPAAD